MTEVAKGAAGRPPTQWRLSPSAPPTHAGRTFRNRATSPVGAVASSRHLGSMRPSASALHSSAVFRPLWPPALSRCCTAFRLPDRFASNPLEPNGATSGPRRTSSPPTTVSRPFWWRNTKSKAGSAATGRRSARPDRTRMEASNHTSEASQGIQRRGSADVSSRLRFVATATDAALS